MGRDAEIERLQAAEKFQFTRPRGARRGGLSAAFRPKVSIHAPAWGATIDALAGYKMQTVSIHAPAWGATALALVRGSGLLVSIHAPAWGATVWGVIYLFL